MADSTQIPSPNTKSKHPFTFLLLVLSPILLGILIYQLDSFNPAPYPPHELTQSAPLTIPKRNSKILFGSEKIGYEELVGPEDLAYDLKSGVIYTGCIDGWVKRVTVNGSAVAGGGATVVEDWVNTGGRPLGLVNGQHGEVIIADGYKDCLPVGDNLLKRHIGGGTCLACGQIGESMRHVLFECACAVAVWDASSFGDRLLPIASSFRELFAWVLHQFTKDEVATFSFLLWNLWKARCSAVYDGAPIYASRLVASTLSGIEEYRQARQQLHLSSPGFSHPVNWNPPPSGTLKCNTDASVADNGSGIGIIFRDSEGLIMASFSFLFDPGVTPVLLEMRAILLAMVEALRLGYSSVIFESDCISCVQALNCASEDFSALGCLGLLNATSEGKIQVLTEEADGLKFKITNAVDIAKDGILYFTDTSYKYSINEAIWEILEGVPHGRLLSYDPSSKQTKVLLQNLYFANGVAVSADNQFIIFCESPLRKCNRYYLQGEKKGTVEGFIDNLPGQPDNIMYDGEGLYWIALVTGHSNSMRLFRKYPLIRKIVAITVKYIGVPNIMEKNAGIIAVDLEGKPIAHYYDENLSMTSSGIKIGDYLYFGSVTDRGITRLDLIRFPAVSVE